MARVSECRGYVCLGPRKSPQKRDYFRGRKMARKRRPVEVVDKRSELEPNAALFSVCVLVLVLVPLVFSTAVFRIYVLPKLLCSYWVRLRS